MIFSDILLRCIKQEKNIVQVFHSWGRALLCIQHHAPWVIRISSLVAVIGSSPTHMWALDTVIPISFRWFFPQSQIVFHKYAQNKVLCWILRGTPCRSPGFSLCSSLWYLVHCPMNSNHCGLSEFQLHFPNSGNLPSSSWISPSLCCSLEILSRH